MSVHLFTKKYIKSTLDLKTTRECSSDSNIIKMDYLDGAMPQSFKRRCVSLSFSYVLLFICSFTPPTQY